MGDYATVTREAEAQPSRTPSTLYNPPGKDAADGPRAAGVWASRYGVFVITPRGGAHHHARNQTTKQGGPSSHRALLRRGGPLTAVVEGSSG